MRHASLYTGETGIHHLRRQLLVEPGVPHDLLDRQPLLRSGLEQAAQHVDAGERGKRGGSVRDSVLVDGGCVRECAGGVGGVSAADRPDLQGCRGQRWSQADRSEAAGRDVWDACEADARCGCEVRGSGARPHHSSVTVTAGLSAYASPSMRSSILRTCGAAASQHDPILRIYRDASTSPSPHAFGCTRCHA